MEALGAGLVDVDAHPVSIRAYKGPEMRGHGSPRNLVPLDDPKMIMS